MPKPRSMSLTPDLVALCHKELADQGPDGRWTAISDAQYKQLAEALERQSHGEPLWVFAYGSLIWKPEFEAIDKQRATAFGWHRSFCLHINRWRGSYEQPGLMMALERGGRCDGVIYRLPDSDRAAQIERMLRREVSAVENVDSVRWLPVKSESGPCRALGFWVGATGERILSRRPLDEVAGILARACGHLGSCAEYLYNTVSHLEDFGIHDRNLWRLQQLVAEEIRTIHREAITSEAC
ncbi:gamma-glutamylcyclotransferase [Rhizobium herbae]|uniref:glutathione-specific gamma-glutamylcyclotransferase n=1 Tax=Rhizobium herbae TaxID=508661 RepID=A0ABS4EP03_9HYPH|nr:gamma-glutamylcyclotransferase [Rhizobium herbae]MBP1859676.1 cation transport protein ChaC [Rhizobium herbae]